MAVEKEADVMRKEIKICLPLYKMAYAVFFTAILSIVRGVFYSYEIGIALEAPMALLAAAFCADTYTREITAKRWEIWRLYSMKNKLSAIFLRLELQEGFLMILSAAGYGMFFWFQKPRSLSLIKEEAGYEAQLFLMYMAAMAVTLYFGESYPIRYPVCSGICGQESDAVWYCGLRRTRFGEIRLSASGICFPIPLEMWRTAGI